MKNPATILSASVQDSPFPTPHPARGSPNEPANPASEKDLSGAARDHRKRVLDMTCIVLGLPGLLLLMAAIAIGIKLVSAGPVFFKQERVGRRRQRFTCWKFRTMTAGTDTLSHQRHLKQLVQSDAPMTKMDAAGDPRLIPFGRLLRAAGLDELPQLINVLRGEMSLVGPRPCTTYELEAYLPWQFARFEALPGLTGLWQVSGKNKTTFTEMVNLDITYAKKSSVCLDVKIMAATFATVASQLRQLRVGNVQAPRQEQVGRLGMPQSGSGLIWNSPPEASG